MEFFNKIKTRFRSITNSTIFSALSEAFNQNLRSRISLMIMVVSVILMFSPLFTNFEAVYESTSVDDLTNLIYPFTSLDHPFGTDMFGRDLLSLIAQGFFYTFGLAIVISLVMMISIFACVIMFITKLEPKSKLRSFIFYVLFALYSYPTVILLFVLVSIFSKSLLFVIIAIVISTTPYVFFSIYNNIEKHRKINYIKMLILEGASETYILKTQIIYLIMPVLVHIFRRVCIISLLEILALGVIGYGYAQDLPDWGTLLKNAWFYREFAYHMLYIVGIVTIVVISSLVFFLRIIEEVILKFVTNKLAPKGGRDNG